MVVLPPGDWDLFEETLAMDQMSPAFDPKTRSLIRHAMEQLEVGTARGGRKIVIRTTQGAWDVLMETLAADARSSMFDSDLREQLKHAMARVTVRPWPGM
jgi:cellobiose phosphorylase